MNRNPNVIQHFIDSIELRGSVSIPAEHLGTILTFFPIVGGGVDCIVITVDEMIVRVVRRSSAWTAEHLVVAEGDA